MKNTFGIILLLCGLYLTLFAGWRLLRISYLDKKWAIECKKTDFQKQNKDCAYDSNVGLTKLKAELKESSRNATILLFIALSILLTGIVLLFHNILKKLKETKSRTCKLIYVFEAFIHISYWLLIAGLYLSMQLIVKQKVTSCVVDCMFIFCVAGFSGFYSAYFMLTNSFLQSKKLKLWILATLAMLFTGAILAYFVPFYLNDVSKLSFNMFVNAAFLQGFILMMFFIFANVIIGTIFKGFFNWVKIVFNK